MKNTIFKKNKNHNNKGFTLIETLVSLTLFTIVVVIAGGTVVSVIDINKRNQAISSVVNNLNYSIDSMVRDIKTGYLYKCDYDGIFTVEVLKSHTNPVDSDGDEYSGEVCKSHLTLVSTISGQDVVVTYERMVDAGDNNNGYIKKTVYNASGSGSSYNITDKINVNIDSLNFTVKNPKAADDNVTNTTSGYGQPSVAVVIKGKAGNQDIEVSNFYVQTFISQRLLNLTNFKKN